MIGTKFFKFYELYSLPSKIIDGVKNYILKMNGVSIAKNTKIRVISKKIKNGEIFLKIQIINSRVLYQICLSNVVSDYNFIGYCEPLSLVQIGFYSKIEEKSRLSCLKNRTLPFPLRLKKKIENKIDLQKYDYNLIEIYLSSSSEIKVRLMIIKTGGLFDISLADLMKDNYLLESIYPPDLLRIGYQMGHLNIEGSLNLDSWI